MAARKLLTPQAILGAIRRHGGLISLVARELGTSRQNIHQRIKASLELRTAVAAAEDELLDVAEGSIVQQLRQGDPSTVRWYLTRKGRSRGYGRSVPSGPELSEQQMEAMVASLGGSVPEYRRALIALGVVPSDVGLYASRPRGIGRSRSG
jgi:hypothetical protein